MHLTLLLIFALSLPAFGQAMRNDVDWEHDWWDDAWEAHVDPEDFSQYRHLEDRCAGADWRYDYLQNDYELKVPDIDDGAYDQAYLNQPEYYQYDYDTGVYDYGAEYNNVTLQRMLGQIYDFALLQGRVTEPEYDWWEGEYSVEIPLAKTARPPIQFVTEQPISVDFDEFDEFGDEWTWQFGPASPFSTVEAQYDDTEGVWEYSFTPRTYDVYGYYDAPDLYIEYDTDEEWFEDWYWY